MQPVTKDISFIHSFIQWELRGRSQVTENEENFYVYTSLFINSFVYLFTPLYVYLFIFLLFNLFNYLFVLFLFEY